MDLNFCSTDFQQSLFAMCLDKLFQSQIVWAMKEKFLSIKIYLWTTINFFNSFS